MVDIFSKAAHPTCSCFIDPLENMELGRAAGVPPPKKKRQSQEKRAPTTKMKSYMCMSVCNFAHIYLFHLPKEGNSSSCDKGATPQRAGVISPPFQHIKRAP